MALRSGDRARDRDYYRGLAGRARALYGGHGIKVEPHATAMPCEGGAWVECWAWVPDDLPAAAEHRAGDNGSGPGGAEATAAYAVGILLPAAQAAAATCDYDGDPDDGGMPYFCALPAGHAGPHASGAALAVRERREARERACGAQGHRGGRALRCSRDDGHADPWHIDASGASWRDDGAPPDPVAEATRGLLFRRKDGAQ